MPTLLKIDVSPRGDHSISRALSQQFAADWQQAHPDGTITTRDLANTSLPFVEMPWILAARTDPSAHDDEQKAAIAIGNQLIAELKAADEWLISTPMYNFSIPARLKAFIDHIVRAGLTFQVNADGSYTGLLTGKKVTVLIACAGDYSPASPTHAIDFEQPYLRFILGFIGVTDVTFLEAGGSWKVDRGMVPRNQYLQGYANDIAAAAR